MMAILFLSIQFKYIYTELNVLNTKILGCWGRGFLCQTIKTVIINMDTLQYTSYRAAQGAYVAAQAAVTRDTTLELCTVHQVSVAKVCAMPTVKYSEPLSYTY